MDSEKFYRASDIFSQNATATRPAKRGILPIKRTQFYALLKAQQFPQPDREIGNTRLWSASLIDDAVKRMKNG